jgi:hypothetical protein
MILLWMCRKTRDIIGLEIATSERETERVRVAPIVEMMVETRLRWFGHVERRPVDSVVRGGRCRPKKTIKNDLEINDLDRDMIFDITFHSGIRLGCCCCNGNERSTEKLFS